MRCDQDGPTAHEHDDDARDEELAEELASARIALTRRLELLAQRPERLLTQTPDEILSALVDAYRDALASMAALTPDPSAGADAPSPAEAPKADEDAAPEPEPEPELEPEPTRVVDLRDAAPIEPEAPDPELVKLSLRSGAKALLSPESAELITHLPELLRTFGALHDAGDPADIQRAIAERIEHGLPSLRDEPMAELVHLFVAMLRRADQDAFLPEESAKRTAALFRTLRFDYTDDRRLYIHGMALAHTPKHGATWADDAAHWLEQLNARVMAVDPSALDAPAPKSSSKHKNDAPKKPAPRVNWPPIFGWRGASIEMLGANANPELVTELEELTGVGSISWTPLQRGAPNMRLVQTLCERVERGTVDLVVVYTAFATHKATQRLKKSLQRAPEVRALWVSGVPSVKNLLDALLEHPEAHL